MIHYGNLNINLKRTPCGELKAKVKITVDPNFVSCQACIKKILSNQTSHNSRTDIWIRRLQELNLSSNIPQQDKTINQ